MQPIQDELAINTSKCADNYERVKEDSKKLEELKDDPNYSEGLGYRELD